VRSSRLPDADNSTGRTDVQATRRTTSVTTYKFGNYLLDQQRACLLRDGQEINLRTKSFELLAYLVVNHSRLITKDESIKAIWPDAFVTDDSLVQCVRNIRRTICASVILAPGGISSVGTPIYETNPRQISPAAALRRWMSRGRPNSCSIFSSKASAAGRSRTSRICL
jgi:hypothetical protein